jgi:hypothetical protein
MQIIKRIPASASPVIFAISFPRRNGSLELDYIRARVMNATANFTPAIARFSLLHILLVRT